MLHGVDVAFFVREHGRLLVRQRARRVDDGVKRAVKRPRLGEVASDGRERPVRLVLMDRPCHMESGILQTACYDTAREPRRASDENVL